MTQEKWVLENQDFYYWYYENYPFLQEYKLPIPYESLVEFYLTDMNKRNFDANLNFANEYENVFSYFIEYYPKDDSEKFTGKTDLQYILNAIPKAFNDVIIEPLETVGGIGADLFKNINKFFPLLLGIALLYSAGKFLK